MRAKLLGMTCLLFAANAAAETTIFVGLPASMEAGDGKEVWQSVTKLLLGEPGTRIQVFDGEGLQKVCDFTVPTGNGINVRARHKDVAPELGKLRAFLKRSSSVRTGHGQIRLPQFLGLVGSGLRSMASDTRILVFGSPYYLDERDKGFTFGGGFFPSDGHILSKDSVFSAAGREGVLAGCAVHFCSLSHQWHSELERIAVVRFWTVYVAELGGVLTTCLASADVTVERVLSGVKDPVSGSKIDRADTKVEMRSVETRPERASGGEPADRSDSRPSESSESSARDRLEQAAKAIPQPKKGFLSIAAVWVSEDDQADVDLWVRPHPKAQELSFQQTTSPEGRYLRDVRAAQGDLGDSNWKASWEVVEVRMATLENTTCWLNLYRGSGAKIEGLVRLLFEDRSVDVPFSFTGIGNEAGDREHRERSPFWMTIDISRAWSEGSKAH